jgi:hypothetical protein
MNAHGAGPSDPFRSESAHPRTGVSNPSIDTDVAKGVSMQSQAKEDAVLTFLDAVQPFIHWRRQQHLLIGLTGLSPLSAVSML